MTRDGDGSWAAAQTHLLAQPMSETLRAWIESDMPYRPVYGGPEHGPKTHPRVPEPWKALREEQPFIFGSASVGEVCVAWLMREFGAARALAHDNTHQEA